MALSADGQVALVGTQFAGSGDGAAYLYAESAGSWPTTPTASFIGTAGEALGSSVALSADGQVALVGAPFASWVNGAAYLYTESAGSWPTAPAATFTGSLGQSLGSSVALSATARLPSWAAPCAILDGGTANVYTESAGRWHTGPVAAFRGGSGELLGSSVALSADGQVALVGATTPAPATEPRSFIARQADVPVQATVVQGLGPGTHFRTHSRSAFRWVLRWSPHRSRDPGCGYGVQWATDR